MPRPKLSTPQSMLCPKLPRGKKGCQRALTKKRTLGRGGVPQRRHAAPLEPFAQLGDALRGVGAVASIIEAAELVVGQTAKEDVCQRALTEARTLGSWFERRVAYLSDCSVKLPLRPSAIAAPPSEPSWLALRLRGWGRRWVWSREVSMGADRRSNTIGWRRTRGWRSSSP